MSDTAQILEALEKLNTRLDSLEAKVDGINGGGAIAPADPLTAKLADPEVNAALVRILSRASAIEGTVNVLDNLSKNGPEMLDMGVEMANVVANEGADAGVDIVQLLNAGMSISKKAVAPESLELVELALDNPRPAIFALKTGAKVFAAFDEAGIDLDKVSDHAVKASVKLAGVMISPEAEKALNSGLLDPKTVGMAEHAGFAITETNAEGARSPGLFGLMGAVFDADVMRFMGFGLTFARKMGKRLA